MEHDESRRLPAVPFAGEYQRRYEAQLRDLVAIKEWRKTELEAGRPSAFSDYCRAHGYCPHCHGTGICLNENGMGYKAVGWDGNVELFEQCEMCGGTGKLVL